MEKKQRRRITHEVKVATYMEVADVDGRAKAEQIVLRAANPEHPAHEYFEWDDAVAGHSFRVQQARQLIDEVSVEFKRGETTVLVPLAVRDTSLPPQVPGFRLTHKLSEREQRDLLLYEIGQLEGHVARVERLAQAFGYADELRAFGRRLKTLRSAVALPANA
jgi:hypothetical protein